MTTPRVAIDDRLKPTADQISTYTRRESEFRQRFLKGVLDTDAVLEGLQDLMEMTIGFVNCNGQPEIPDWADKKNPIIQHISCGRIDPSKFFAANVFKDGEEILGGEDFLLRAQAVPGAMNACAFDFYAKPENWKYLPDGVKAVVFPETIFRFSDGYRCVRCLCRDGAAWHRDFSWLSSRFRRGYLVASLASAQPLETKPS